MSRVAWTAMLPRTKSGALGWFAVVTTVSLTLPSTAAAQLSFRPLTGFATAHLGATAGGDVGASPSAGASVAIVEESGLGAEIDFGYGAGSESRLGPGSVQSYMVNFAGVWPTGQIRPFVVAGGGAMHVRGCNVGCTRTISWTDWGWNAGAGAYYVMNEWLAFRGDVRYLAELGDHPDPERPRNFDFWRVSVGATFVWGISP